MECLGALEWLDNDELIKLLWEEDDEIGSFDWNDAILSWLTVDVVMVKLDGGGAGGNNNEL